MLQVWCHAFDWNGTSTDAKCTVLFQVWCHAFDWNSNLSTDTKCTVLCYRFGVTPLIGTVHLLMLGVQFTPMIPSITRWNHREFYTSRWDAVKNVSEDVLIWTSFMSTQKFKFKKYPFSVSLH